MSTDWFWEGNVAEAVAQHLRLKSWTIVTVANTASKQRGVDVLAEKDGRTLAVEVKGFPSTSYADPRRALETKRTLPTNQANKWFAHAILAVMKYRGDRPHADIAMALPDFPTYRTLIAKTKRSLEMLQINVWLVAEDGSVADVVATSCMRA